MRRTLAALLGCVCFCMSALSWAAPPVEAFGRTPAVQFLALSPSGKLLAWLDNEGATPLIKIFDVATRATRKRLGPPPNATVRDLSWFDEETLFLDASMPFGPDSGGATYEWHRITSLNIATGESRVLLHNSGPLRYVPGGRLLSGRTSTPKKVIMSSWGWSTIRHMNAAQWRGAGGRKNSGWTNNLYQVDTRTGNPTQIEMGTQFTKDWVVDAASQPVARSEWREQRFTLLHRRDGNWHEVFSASDEAPEILGLASDGGGVLLRGALNRPYSAIWRVAFDGSTPQLLIGDEISDVGEPIYDPNSHALIGARGTGARSQVFWLDEGARARSESLAKTFGGRDAFVLGRSNDGNRALVSVATHATPAIYYLVDYKRHTADIVGEPYPLLAGTTLGEVRELTYKARDGHEIPAFLTLPAGAEENHLPLVVLPHDGPESHDTRSFDWLAQFLASRGYAVLQPQFRGSTGHGEAHRKAGYRQWGRLMQDDVTDGVQALIQQGSVDPKRVCIVGTGYGGYAALAGAAFTPDLYACAVSINGMSNLPAMLAFQEVLASEESDSVAYWRNHIGPKNGPDIVSKSPTRATATIRAPVLLLHGVNDTVVPIAQSREMAKALKSAGKPHTLIELSGEDHWLSHSETRMRVLKEIETFLANHLQGT